MEKENENEKRSLYLEVLFIILVISMFMVMISINMKPSTTIDNNKAVKQESNIPNEKTEVKNKIKNVGKVKAKIVENTYFIDDIDFAPFNKGEESLNDVMSKMSYDRLRILVTTINNGAVDILADKNLYTMHEAMGTYKYILVFPKEPAEVTIEEKYVCLNQLSSEGKEFYFYSFIHGEDIQGENLEVPVYVTYKDGTEETITLYITKNYGDK